MQVIELAAPGLNNLRPAVHSDPRPGPNEVLVRLRGASLNYVDLMVANGLFPVAYPLVPVADGAGDVVETGAGVSGWKAGDRVIPHFLASWTGGAFSSRSSAVQRGINAPGSLAEYAVLAADALVATPVHLTDEQAAMLPIAATTAWNALAAGRIRSGDTVLLLGTGGVSMFALQLAKAAGASVIITSSSDEKLQRARALGADLVINYREQPEWDAEVLALTGGRGVDLVLETGGSATFNRSLNAVRAGGMVFVIGLLSGVELKVNVLTVIQKAIRIQGNNTGSVEHLREAARAIAVNRIVPVVDQVFDWKQARAGYETMARAAHMGKLAFTIGA